MSSRVLKKLQGDIELPAKDVELKDDEDENEQLSDDDLDLSRGKGNHLNPFDLLNQSFSESEVKEDDNETEHASTAATLAASVSKKKKKKRKKKTKYTGNHISSEDNELTDKYLSDFDSLIGKVAEATGQKAQLQIDKSLLIVELKNLNPQNEMRRTFGKRVVKIEQHKRGRQKHTLKTTYMVTAKDFWPPITKNIITTKPVPPHPDIVGTQSSNGTSFRDKIIWFAFEHSPSYQSVQSMFLSAIETTESDVLISLVRRCPYHVDSLIQLSELCKMTEDFALAGELIERALFVLETSLHPSFSLTNGNSRLDYRRQENRSFFIVLFKQAQYLEARACSRTAFEMSKLILSLSPDVDPLAMVLIMDYYALRSKQYSWLVKFYEEYDALRNLSQLPNMAYSYALALFCLHGDCEKSNQALQYALLMFPGVLRPLLEELSVQTDKRVMASSYFNPDISSNQTPALNQLVLLYVCRAKIVWRQNSSLTWLEANVNATLDIIERKDDIIVDYAQKRTTRYGQPPRPILRHVILSDFKEKVPLARFLIKEKDSIMMYDPLPPLDSVNCYDRKSSSSSPTTNTASNHPVSMFFQSFLPSFNLNNTGDQNAVAAANPPAAIEIAGAIAGADGVAAPAVAPAIAVPLNNDELAHVDRQLQALNMNLENAEAVAGGVESGVAYQELTRSLTNIVDAMRDFLQNFSIGESVLTGHNADGDNGGSSEEEDTRDYSD